MKYILTIVCSFLIFTSAHTQTKVWFDTDMMIGLPERAPREVDDAVTLIMALKMPSIKIVGLSTVTYPDYGVEISKKIINWHGNGQQIPLYKGSPMANDLCVENEATQALYKALQKEKLTILALGPVTNIATVIKNHPDIVGQIDSIIMCAARTTDFKFMPGLEKLVVYDYNYEKDTASMHVLLQSNINLVFAGFESSKSLLIGKVDIDRLKTGKEGDEWLYQTLRLWQQRALNLFGVDGFIPYDCTVLGILTHPQYFKTYRNIPVDVVIKENDAQVVQKTILRKPFLEVNYRFSTSKKVQFVYTCLPGFEELILEKINQ